MKSVKNHKWIPFFILGLAIPIVFLGYSAYVNRIPQVERDIAKLYDVNVDDVHNGKLILRQALVSHTLSDEQMTEAKRLLATKKPILQGNAIAALGELYSSPRKAEAATLIEGLALETVPAVSSDILNALRKLASPKWRPYAQQIINNNDEGAIDVAKMFLEKGEYVPKVKK